MKIVAVFSDPFALKKAVFESVAKSLEGSPLSNSARHSEIAARTRIIVDQLSRQWVKKGTDIAIEFTLDVESADIFAARAVSRAELAKRN